MCSFSIFKLVTSFGVVIYTPVRCMLSTIISKGRGRGTAAEEKEEEGGDGCCYFHVQLHPQVPPRTAALLQAQRRSRMLLGSHENQQRCCQSPSPAPSERKHPAANTLFPYSEMNH